MPAWAQLLEPEVAVRVRDTMARLPGPEAASAGSVPESVSLGVGDGAARDPAIGGVDHPRVVDQGRPLSMAAGRLPSMDHGRPLRVADLAPGIFGVLDAQVTAIAPARPYRRKAGGEGVLQRVTLSDPSGSVVLVLWDDETRRIADGSLRSGAWIRLRGAAAQEGYRGGGTELKLGSAVLEPMAAPVPPRTAGLLEGHLAFVGPTRIIGAPPSVRFQADVTLETPEGPATIVLWDESVRLARQLLPGSPIEVCDATPHPNVPGWFLAGRDARLRLKR